LTVITRFFVAETTIQIGSKTDTMLCLIA